MMAKRLEETRDIIRYHNGQNGSAAFFPKSDLSRGYTVSQVADKHDWKEPLVWSIALERKDDLERFKQLNWGLSTWDLWNFNDCDKRFGDEQENAGSPQRKHIRTNKESMSA